MRILLQLILLFGLVLDLSCAAPVQKPPAKAQANTHLNPKGAARVEDLDLDVDEEDCSDGAISMDVVVNLRTNQDSHRETFNPSCGFTFSEDFTRDGVHCRVESGMCSGFMGAGRLTVRCQGDGLGQEESADFNCPEK